LTKFILNHLKKASKIKPTRSGICSMTYQNKITLATQTFESSTKSHPYLT
jgi:hypothetical protein